MLSANDRSASPLIAVIIPIYNGADFLPGVLDNLRAQTYRPLEIILIDDGSTDDSAALAARACIDTPEWRICCIRQENAGPSAARNAGLRRTQADLIQFLDVDDLLPPDKLLDQARRLIAEPALDVIGGYIQVVNLPGADARNLFFDNIAPQVTYNLGAALFRRRVFDRIGDFNPAFRLGEDIDLFLRIIEASCTMVITTQVALYYRQHERNITRSRTRADHRQALLRIMRESLRRRSQAGARYPMPQLTDFIEADKMPDE